MCVHIDIAIGVPALFFIMYIIFFCDSCIFRTVVFEPAVIFITRAVGISTYPLYSW